MRVCKCMCACVCVCACVYVFLREKHFYACTFILLTSPTCSRRDISCCHAHAQTHIHIRVYMHIYILTCTHTRCHSYMYGVGWEKPLDLYTYVGMMPKHMKHYSHRPILTSVPYFDHIHPQGGRCGTGLVVQRATYLCFDG